MSLELHESHSNVTLDAIRRLFRRNSRVTLYKLIQIDPAISTGPFVATAIDIISVFSYFLIAGSLLPLK